VEGDIEVIDLEANHLVMGPQKPMQCSLRRPRINEIAAEDVRQIAEARLQALVKEAIVLESRLQGEILPGLEAATRTLEEKKSRAAHLQNCMEAASAQSREKSLSLEGVKRLQLHEVRQLTRSPPEHVRRLLAAVWLVLNFDRFQGKTAVQVDEVRVWHLCQKMLGDNSFTSRLQAFDPTSLDEVPHLTLYIARNYLGFQEPEVKLRESQESTSSPDFLRSRPSTTMSAAPSRHTGTMSKAASTGSLHKRSASKEFTTDAWSTLRNSTPQKRPSTQQSGLRADPWAAVHSGAFLDTMRQIGLSPSRPSTGHGTTASRPSTGYGTCARPSSKFVILAPLEIEDVRHASEPCGALMQWLQDLVLERAKHASLQQERAHAVEEVAAAEKAQSLAEQGLLELRADLEAIRAEQLNQEQAIAKLQQGVTQTPTPTNVGSKVDVATLRQRGKRGKWLRPAFDISGTLTLTMTNLQNTTWWRSCERVKLMSPANCSESPSRAAKSFGLW